MTPPHHSFFTQAHRHHLTLLFYSPDPRRRCSSRRHQHRLTLCASVPGRNHTTLRFTIHGLQASASPTLATLSHKLPPHHSPPWRSSVPENRAITKKGSIITVHESPFLSRHVRPQLPMTNDRRKTQSRRHSTAALFPILLAFPGLFAGLSHHPPSSSPPPSPPLPSPSPPLRTTDQSNQTILCETHHHCITASIR